MPSVNNLRPGSSVIDRIFFGDTEVSAAYFDDTLLYHVQDESSSSSTIPYKRELAYLQCSGTQYIDTGITPNESTGCLGEWENGTIGTELYIFCSDYFYAPLYNSQERMATAIYSYCSRFVEWWPDSRDRSVPHTTGVNFMNSGNAIYDSYTTTLSYGGNIPQYTAIMFKYKNSNGVISEGQTGKIYWLKVSQGSSLVRDFIPVMDNNDVPCMYDRVTRQLYYNSGTGSFLYGEKTSGW